MVAFEAASVEQNIIPFIEFLSQLIKKKSLLNDGVLIFAVNLIAYFYIFKLKSDVSTLFRTVF